MVLPHAVSPVAGLRAIELRDEAPVGFLVGTGAFSLAEHHAAQPTTGLDLTRERFEAARRDGAALAPNRGAAFMVFDP